LRIDRSSGPPAREGSRAPEAAPPPRRAAAVRAHIELMLTPRTATALLSCPNSEQGATAFMASIGARGGRVIESEQHLNAETGYLFQRLHADISQVAGGAPQVEALLAEVSQHYGMTLTVQRTERRKRVGIMVSKYDHCLYDLLLRHRAGELDCDIPVIISNHPDASRVARQFGIDFQVIGKTAANKSEAEEQECALLLEEGVDLVVMARYMQVLSDTFVSRWERRVINIHHSFLPAFIGAKPYHQAHQRGVKLIGATAHYATANLDEGPIIEQDVARCSHKDSAEDLVRKGRDLEKQVLARAVRWHLDNRVIIHGNKTVVFD
jgi:formyltetrahydrofolate deformylase